MRDIFAIGTSLLFVLSSSNAWAQVKKVTILGSSTAAGLGVTIEDSAWVWRLRAYFNRNPNDGLDTTVKNLAVSGYDTYKSLPDGYPHPAGRPDPDPGKNVTYVLNDLPRADVVLINYPTNDIAYGYDPKEMMDNLRLMYNQFTQNGIRCYITTTQPRDFDQEDLRNSLRRLVDSIQLNFGNYAINFWDDVAMADGYIKPEVNSGDGIHLNNLGHRLLFQSVQAKNILSAVAGPLPLVITNWQATLEDKFVKLSWNTAYEGADTYFEIQRSKDGKDFQTIYQKTANEARSYSWTDLSPASGKNFYRLKMIEAGKTSYTRIIQIINDTKQLVTSFYADASELRLQLNSKNQSVNLTIINFSGTIVKQQSLKPNSSSIPIKIPISELAFGNYYLRVSTSNGSSVIEKFIKMK